MRFFLLIIALLLALATAQPPNTKRPIVILRECAPELQYDPQTDKCVERSTKDKREAKLWECFPGYSYDIKKGICVDLHSRGKREVKPEEECPIGMRFDENRGECRTFDH